MEEYRRANQALWNEYTRINAGSQLYDLDSFKAGRSSLHALELEEVGPVAGKSLLHLQCHFGMDTLSWARLGARVTGIDFSPEAIALARSLSTELKQPARFIHSDLYDLPNQLDETFDIVYTSYGVLTWLSDLGRWAEIAARYVKPGGIFYIAEFHPTSYLFSDQADDWQVEYDYFDEGAQAFPVEGCYSDRSARLETKTAYEWNYPIGKVVTSLIAAGLQLEYLHEFPYMAYQGFQFLEKGPDRLWRPPAGTPRVPLLFSIRAKK